MQSIYRLKSILQGLVVLPVLLSLIGPSPHDANIVMEDFYKEGAGATDSSEGKEGDKGGVEMEMKDTKVEVIEAEKANGVAPGGAHPV